jgi:hypothetical protein
MGKRRIASSSGNGYRGPIGPTLSLLALVVAASLALVAPTNGLCAPEAHEFLPIHPLFSHDHDPHAAHRSSEISPSVAAATSVADPMPIIAAADAFGPGRGLVVSGMVPGLSTALLALAVASGLRANRRPLLEQAWAEVPTGPPR